MPEGHTIHRIAQDHRQAYVQQRLRVSSPQGRFTEGAAQLDRRLLKAVEAHGKHLFYVFSGNRTLHIHLGLYGKFHRRPVPPPEPRGQVRLRVAGSAQAFDLIGPNACHLVSPQEKARLLARLGPDPLRDDALPALAWQRIQRSRAAIGKLLLDQSVLAGVGNVYRCEVLHLLGIHPERAGRDLSAAEFQQLWEKLTELLRIGRRYNRIIVADPADVGKSRSRMGRQERLLVYKKDHCGRCDGPIKSWDLGARKIYACPHCQA